MATYTAVLDGSKTNVEGHSKFLNRLFGPGVATGINPDSLKVVQRAAGANMSVDVSVGDCHLQLPTLAYSFWCWTDAATNAVISPADPTNPRIDTIVAWCDTTVTTTASNNSPGSLKFRVIAGTPAGTPVATSDVAIQSTLGSTIAWTKLATVAVAAAATNITNAVITDARSALGQVAPIAPGSISSDSMFSTNFNPKTRFLESLPDFVASGLAWSVISGLNAQMSAGVVYIGGMRIAVSAIASKTFTINQDTYIDVNSSGTIVYTAVSNNATVGMTLAAGHKRLAKVVTNGTVITRIELVGYDPLGNRLFNTVSAVPDWSHFNAAGNAIFSGTADGPEHTARFAKPKDIMTIGSAQVVRYQPFIRSSVTANVVMYRGSFMMKTDAAFATLETGTAQTAGMTANLQTLPLVIDVTSTAYWATYDFANYAPESILRIGLHRDGGSGNDTSNVGLELEGVRFYYNKDYSKSA